MDDTFGGMSADEFFLLHNAFVDEDDDGNGLRCQNCIHCDSNGWCDIKGDYVDACYNDCEDFES